MWNDELAAVAQRWSEQCYKRGGHDRNRNKIDGTKVGQNAAWDWNSRKSGRFNLI